MSWNKLKNTNKELEESFQLEEVQALETEARHMTFSQFAAKVDTMPKGQVFKTWLRRFLKVAYRFPFWGPITKAFILAAIAALTPVDEPDPDFEN